MKVVLKGKDGSVAIMSLAEGANMEDAVQKFKNSHEEGFYVDYFKFEGELPLSREYRDAWKIVGSKLEVDEGKAMDIHLGRIREKRNEKLEALDKEALRYMSSPLKMIQIEEEKQKLRDIPQTFKLALGEWPVELI